MYIIKYFSEPLKLHRAQHLSSIARQAQTEGSLQKLTIDGGWLTWKRLTRDEIKVVVGGSSRCFALLLDDLPSGPFC